jgi:hypothetical protein
MLNIESLKRDAKTFGGRPWLSDDNKRLLNLVIDQRLNLAPCTVKKFDSLGFNHFEIISLAQMAGKVIHKLSTSDIDMLNDWQERFNLVFAYDKKQAGKYSKAKLDGFEYAFKNGMPYGSCAILTLGVYKCVK